MPTRLKRPSIVKRLSISVMLIAFLAYLGFSALSGQFGIKNREDIVAEMRVLEIEAAILQDDIDILKHRISLFESERIDPDILTERARALLSMARPEDVYILDSARN